MILLSVDISKARTIDEEYWYWYDKLNNKVDEKLPWDMHPNELRASIMYRKKITRRLQEVVDKEEYEPDIMY